MDFEALYREIVDMPASGSRTEALRDAVRQADQANDLSFSFRFRMELIDDAAYDGRFSDVRDAFAAIGWVLKKLDDNWLTSIDIDNLLDKEQWICRWIVMYPDITLPQLDNLLSDLRQRLTNAGYQHRFYYEAVMISAVLTDQRKKATEAFLQYSKGKKDNFLDCDDCIACRMIKYYRYIGNHSEAMKLGATLTWPGICNMNPKTAYNELVASAVENNEYQGIEPYQQKAYKMIANDQFFLDFIGYHMQYFAHTVPMRGVDLYKKHLSWTTGRNRFPLALYDFHMGASVLFRRFFLDGDAVVLAKLGKRAGILMQHHYNEALRIAKKIDARNGTKYYTEKLERLFEQ